MAATVYPLPMVPGTYVLAVSMQHQQRIQVGKLACLDFYPGAYAYVGSAFGPGGLSARLNRHLGQFKKKHWHIDYLLDYARVEFIWMAAGRLSLEHQWAAALGRGPLYAKPIRGFGCSDCRCASHLFHFACMPRHNVVEQVLGAQWLWARGKGRTSAVRRLGSEA